MPTDRRPFFPPILLTAAFAALPVLALAVLVVRYWVNLPVSDEWGTSVGFTLAKAREGTLSVPLPVLPAHGVPPVLPAPGCPGAERGRRRVGRAPGDGPQPRVGRRVLGAALAVARPLPTGVVTAAGAGGDERAALLPRRLGNLAVGAGLPRPAHAALPRGDPGGQRLGTVPADEGGAERGAGVRGHVLFFQRPAPLAAGLAGARRPERARTAGDGRGCSTPRRRWRASRCSSSASGPRTGGRRPTRSATRWRRRSYFLTWCAVPFRPGGAPDAGHVASGRGAGRVVRRRPRDGRGGRTAGARGRG